MSIGRDNTAVNYDDYPCPDSPKNMLFKGYVGTNNEKALKILENGFYFKEAIPFSISFKLGSLFAKYGALERARIKYPFDKICVFKAIIKVNTILDLTNKATYNQFMLFCNNTCKNEPFLTQVSNYLELFKFDAVKINYAINSKYYKKPRYVINPNKPNEFTKIYSGSETILMVYSKYNIKDYSITFF